MSVWSHDAHSGEPLLEVFPSSGSGTPQVGGDGTGSFVIPLRDPKTAMPQSTARDMFRVNDRILALRDGDDVEYAGIIASTSYNRDKGVLTVRTEEIRQIFRQRMPFGVNQYPLGDLAVTGKSLSGAVRAILTRGMQIGQAGETQWALPIDLPADGSGTFTASWKNYQVFTIEDLLEQVEAEGAEVVFTPYLTGSGLLRFQTGVTLL